MDDSPGAGNLASLDITTDERTASLSPYLFAGCPLGSIIVVFLSSVTVSALAVAAR